MKTILIFTTFLFFTFGKTQEKKPYEEFKHFKIIKKNDTINFHVFSKNDLREYKKIIVFFQGSGADPIYQTMTINDTIKNDKNEVTLKPRTVTYSSNMLKLKSIPNDYALILISKKSIPFHVEGEFKTPKSFYESEGLKYRAEQGNEVINYVTKNLIVNPKKIIVIGHSEGSDVVAKLGTINKKITHIGFWSGGANTQFYDFALFYRKDAIAGKATEEETKEQLENLFTEIKDIYKYPNNTEKKWLGNSYKRWTEFSEPSIDNLLKINIPIFVAHGAKDNAVPIESNLLIPIEFIKNKKSNLTYKMYPNLDHGFRTVPKNENEKSESKVQEIFEEFLKWTE